MRSWGRSNLKGTRLLILTVALFGAISATEVGAQGTQGDPILSKLERAKTTYRADAKKFESTVDEYIDKQIEIARKAGNKPAIDALNLEFEAFHRDAIVPPSAPEAFHRKQMVFRGKLADAFETAVKDYTKKGADSQAKGVTEELQAFRAFDEVVAIKKKLVGTWTLRLSGYTTDLIFHPNGTLENTTAKKTLQWKIDLPAQEIRCMEGEKRWETIRLPLVEEGTHGVNAAGNEFTVTKRK